MVKAVKLEGSSMRPLFEEGDIALVSLAPCPEAPPFILAPGDCVVYRHEGRRLLHRVLAVSGFGPQVSDDAGRIAAHHVAWRNVEGRVISRNRLKKGLVGLLYSNLKRILSFA